MLTGRYRQSAGACCVLFAVLAAALSGCNAINGYAMNQSGMTYFHQASYSMARDEFRRAVADAPYNADYINNLAAAMKKQGDVVAAEQTYRYALNVDPSHQPSYHGLAKLLVEQDRQPEAMEVLQTWAGSQPYSPAAHVEMAWLQRESGDLTGAEQSLQMALKVHPNHPIALAHLGQLYQDSGQNQRAIAMYQRSLYSYWYQPQVRSRLTALKRTTRPTWTARGFAPQQPYYASGPYRQHYGWQPAPVVQYGRPQHVILQQPLPSYNQATVVAPGVVGGGPVQLAPPVINADPAHSPNVSSAVPLVQPY